MTTVGTVCYIRRNGRLLLQKKATGLFGGGKWNAPGGKLRKGESPEDATRREVEEETGLRVGALRSQGVLTFFFGEGEEPAFVVYVFSCDSFQGRPRSGIEGELRWFSENALPYDQMWADDRHWLPQVLAGRSVEGTFWFDEPAANLLRYEVLTR